MRKHDRIEINPNVMFGKPVIKNTRITVEQILRKLAGGMTSEEIMIDHPHLKPEDIYAAQDFAADYLADEIVLRKKPHNLARVFELLADMSEDFMANGRRQPSVQEREPF